MSRTNQSTNSASTNPASKFIEWKSSGHWSYYDKDKKEEVELPSDIPFIVLDQLNTIKGWSDRKQSGMWSNEVRKISDSLTLRTKDGILAIGKWSEIKANPICEGAKFTKSVYAMAKVNGVYELVNFQFKGSSLTPWIDLSNLVGGDSGLYGDVVFACTEVTDEKKGSVKFKKPVFSVISKTLSPEAAKQADDMDTALQAHFKAYFSKSEIEDTSEAPKASTDSYTAQEVLDEDLPF